MIRKIDCIDCGTEFCPCKLAETNECLVCSQLQGKCFCDCVNWKGICVYQELYNNGGKAKKGRNTYCTAIKSVDEIEKDLFVVKLFVTHKLAIDLSKAGSYVFLCPDDNNFFDIPISIMESNTTDNFITIVVEIRGIKTTKLQEALKKDTLNIRAPYFNSVFGLDDLNKQINNNVLVLARGIGFAPMMPIIKTLYNKGNEIDVFYDSSPFKGNLPKELLTKYNITSKETNLLDKGNLSMECKFIIDLAIKDKDITFIHLSGTDILTYNVIEYLDLINRKDILLSCCNNFKMCCGEGICGSCTARFSGHTVRRFCKEQCSPRIIFEGRRFI